MKKWNISFKNLKKDQLLIILLSGVLLAIIAIPTGSGNRTGESDKIAAKTEQDTAVTADGSTYEEELEARLKSVLAMVEGVGEVEVMITLKSSSEKVVEKDKQSTNDVTTEADSEGGSRENKSSTSSEATLYEESTPYVVKEIKPEIEGVVVIAEGGDNSITAAHISEAVMALFQVQAHKIKVMKMN